MTVGVAGCLLLTGCIGQSASSGSSDTTLNANAKNVTLGISSNSIVGGKNASGAEWIVDYVIPTFTAMEKAKGVTVHITFNGDGSDDGSYQQKQILALRTGGGGDILEIDGTDVGDYSESGLIKPLADVVGASTVNSWDGWSQISKSVQQLDEYNGQAYGIPDGTDGRVLFYNKTLFARAGLPTNWQPKSWADIISAAQALKKLPGVTPIQVDGGTAMTETTTVNGFLPMLAGAGQLLYSNGKWQGNTAAMRAALGFYQQIFSKGLADPVLNEEAQGRNESFAEFAANQTGIYSESDYLWRSILSPTVGNNKMPDRDSAVGYALIPAQTPGSGIGGQDFVSYSGGGDRVINPHTKYPQQAWQLMTFMASAPAMEIYETKYLGGSTQIMPRNDVNTKLVNNDPLLKFVSTKVLPVTHFRPSEGDYTQVSALVQQATADVISGKSPADAAATYATALAKVVGKGNVVDN
ncbi:MAG TPA: extracellular solute-binding protein [Pseudonocardiaceae bacterium]|nr:extracellular solute-binding protein [Pseudonocardiaceae bacterium]